MTTFSFAREYTKRFLMCFFIVTLLITPVPDALATTEVETLQNQISDRNNRLKEIEREIANYQTELKKVGGEKKHAPKSHHATRT
jgi:hypothetical protein